MRRERLGDRTWFEKGWLLKKENKDKNHLQVWLPKCDFSYSFGDGRRKSKWISLTCRDQILSFSAALISHTPPAPSTPALLFAFLITVNRMQTTPCSWSPKLTFKSWAVKGMATSKVYNGWLNQAMGLVKSRAGLGKLRPTTCSYK